MRVRTEDGRRRGFDDHFGLRVHGTIKAARNMRLIIVALAIVAIAGCHAKTADDDMAAGDQAVQAHKLSDAEADYQSAISSSPSDPRPHLALGKVYLLEQKNDPAELEFMKALDIDPKNADAHAALGGVYAAQARLELAEAQYRAAVALDPPNTNFRLSLGSTLQKENKLPTAEAEFLTAVGLQPKNAHAHLALADLLNVQPDRRTEADAEYAEVRALDPRLIPNAAASPAPAAESTPAPSGPTAPAAVTHGAPALRQVDRKFLLTHDSPVYQNADSSSKVVAQVHRRRYVHVTGVQGDWLRIKMRNGTIGFIPISAAE
ncbi:MAG TPA: tetratricopeptide repeat protein [Candidatus Binataceae bacterium]|nr:tetratricopeptide repeat protein [Candidatus Binataceae bacterium]